MSNSINSVNILGYLGGNPNVGVSQGGVAYAQLSLGCNQSWKDRGGNPQKRTDWIQVVAFNGLATSLSRLQKGDQVAVSGRLQSKIREDKEGGKRTVVEIVATTVQFLRLKERPAGDADDAGDAGEAGATAVEPLGEGYEDDDIPF